MKQDKLEKKALHRLCKGEEEAEELQWMGAKHISRTRTKYDEQPSKSIDFGTFLLAFELLGPPRGGSGSQGDTE